MATKEDVFSVVYIHGVKHYHCGECRRIFTSKRSVFAHLHSSHSYSPLKKVKKLYLCGTSHSVPRSTAYRWKKQRQDEDNLPSSGLQYEKPSFTNDTRCQENLKKSVENLAADKKSPPTKDFQEQPTTSSSDSPNKQPQTLCNLELDPDDSHCYAVLENPMLASRTSNCSVNIQADNIPWSSMSTPVHNDSEDLSICSLSSPDQTDSESEEYSICSPSILSSSSDSESSSTSFIDSDSNEELCENESPHLSSTFAPPELYTLSIQESQALSILFCFLKHRLTASACKDILRCMKSLFPDSEVVQQLNMKSLWNSVQIGHCKEYHYCPCCETVFPFEDLDKVECVQASCSGLRYKGKRLDQQKKCRRPQASFVLADVQKQLQDLLQSSGIMREIEETRERFEKNSDSPLTDLTDGSAYRDFMEDDSIKQVEGFLTITALFNTDGVNLYSSSKVELWPLFLAINELTPTSRFARGNMLLAGIWQGKGKPPFEQYLTMFSQEMNTLFNNGVRISVNGKMQMVRLAVICCTLDLPAKASVLNMTMFNGADACITCEEPGCVVKQGKGHSRCFPHKNTYPFRSDDSIRMAMHSGSKTKRVKGFKGPSGLFSLRTLNFAKGFVPDYMHCVLLGITKTLLSKWLSASQAGKEYFVGKQLKNISSRLSSIRPPEFIERLPRDLEKHYMHFKATELQTFLLFYGLPCLDGILPDKFLDHFSQLSEGVYLLLKDQITAADLERAESLLNNFYKSFPDHYGSGSCGLNVHNAGVHLVHSVRLWGPLWAWSCFPFEDSNASLLQCVHGTGSVMKQALKIKQAQTHLMKRGLSHCKTPRKWTHTTEAANCTIAGRLECVPQADRNRLEFQSFVGKKIKKVSRVVLNGQRFCSAEYARMAKRVCNVVQTNSQIVVVKYFLIDEETMEVFAYTQCTDTSPGFEHLSGGLHLTAVTFLDRYMIIPLESFTDTLIFISVDESGRGYASKKPNKHGHAIFK